MCRFYVSFWRLEYLGVRSVEDQKPTACPVSDLAQDLTAEFKSEFNMFDAEYNANPIRASDTEMTGDILAHFRQECATVYIPTTPRAQV